MVLRSRGIAAVGFAVLLAIVGSLAPHAQAQGGSLRARQGDVPALAAPVEASLKLDESLVGATGRVEVVVRLSEGPAGTAAAQRAQRDMVARQQDEVLAAVRAIDPSARLLGRARMVLNALMLELDAATLGAVASDGRVVTINRVVDYERDLAETVSYIGARPEIQNLGSRGSGVTVAVLDSGIDYTHAAFGGPGTLAAYQAAYGTSTDDPRNKRRDGLFPTARVVEGYDFVGERWAGGANSPPLEPDEDPIDCGARGVTQPSPCAGGHGTHVADIIGGILGVAPEVSLYAVKVCSAVSTACSGVALIQAMDYVVDPNGDGDTSDHVDIVNMSLGSPYGTNYDDDLSIAVDAATAVGVLTVASAGNSADKPYIVGTPSAARTALSVAQTEVPSARQPLLQILTPPSIAGTVPAVFQPWSVLPSGPIEAPVLYDTTNAGTRLGCSDAAGTNPWTGTPLAGKIVLVDRGTCSFSLKIANIGAAGGVAGIIGLVAPGDPFAGGYGGGNVTIPGFMISQADSNRIKSGGNAVTMRIDPANWPSLVGTVVGSSSRGPAGGHMFYGNSTMWGQIIKPEIAAPGASISAVAGSGTGTEPFGGTSGAAPMVSGAAALVLRASNHQLSPLELKARLMNTGETTIYNTSQALGGILAPITRIGGGEVRVDRAMTAPVTAWESVSRGGALSFGFVDADQNTTLTRRVVLRNYGNRSVTFSIQPTFRYADDSANGAVSLSVQGSVTVPAGAQRLVQVRLTIDASKLRQWLYFSGSQGADPNPLTTLEYDGYLRFVDTSNAANNIHMPWQVLPRLSSNVRGPSTVRVGVPATYTNRGAGPAYIDTYSLIGTSPILPAPGAGQNISLVDLHAVGYATYADPGLCGNTYLLEFAVNNHYRQSHAMTPGQIRINLDTDRDGVFDFQVRNADFTLNQITDGRFLSWVINLRTGAANAFFYSGHTMESANWTMLICGSQLADPARPAAQGGPLAVPAIGQPINAQAQGVDIYNSGFITDEIENMVFAPGGERYKASISDIPAGGTAQLTVLDTGSRTNTETGVLLLLTGARGGVASGAPEGREALVVTVR